MAQLIVRVELRGSPDGDVYQRLHAHMANLNYSTTIPSTVGSLALPHAVYQGTTAEATPDVLKIAGALQSGVESQIWTKAIVLVMAVSSWAQSGPSR